MKTIGSILLDVELVTPEDIERALELQKQTGHRLGEVLVNLGVVSDDDIRWALAEQLNLPYVNIRKDQIDLEVATMIPEKLARRYHVIPILKIDDELTVVVDDPLNTTIIKDIEAITRCRVKISLGRTSDIMLAIDEIYGGAEEDFQKKQEMPPQFLSAWFVEDDIQGILNDPSGHALLQSVLANAFAHAVSRIYFQPGFQTGYISYRVHGVIRPQIQLGKEWYSIALFRLKISAGFDLSTARQPQYREFSYWEHLVGKNAPAYEEQVKLAVSIFPTTAGESAVLHVINKSVKTLAELAPATAFPAFQQRELLAISDLKTTLAHLKAGGIFLAGSPYADKITTLYSLLQEVDPVRKNIVTLEAYTEYGTDQYAQIRYFSGNPWEVMRNDPTKNSAPSQPPIPEQSLTSEELSPEVQKESTRPKDADKPGTLNAAYHLRPGAHLPNPAQKVLSSWLAALKPHDADVLLVDCIGSDVVLSQCLEYAAQHLLLGAFDFREVFEILAYCLDCQIKPSALVSQVYTLLAQHTVHLLCQDCKQPDTTDFGKQLIDRLPPAFVAAHPAKSEIFASVGCPACHGTGYSQRIILFEVLKMEPWLKEMLLTHTPLADIRRTASEKGFVAIEQKSIDLLLTGKTSIEQILSIVV